MTLIPLHYRHIWDTVKNRPDLTDFWILYLPNLIRVYPLCVHLVCTLRETLDPE